MSNKINILLCFSGSVAAVKVKNIYSAFKSQINCDIKLVATENALKFLSDVDLKIYKELDQWEIWKKIGDEILHIELAKWADIICIAPIDANTIGKIANGIVDNLLTSIIIAFSIEKQIYFCPAMNTTMWNHPAVINNIEKLKSWGYIMIDPIIKKLACGDYGCGGMEEPDEIVKFIKKNLLNL